MTLIIPSTATHTSKAARVLNETFRRAISLHRQRLNGDVDACALTLPCFQSGEFSDSKISCDTITLGDVRAYVFTDLSMIVARQGSLFSKDETFWIAHPTLFRVAKTKTTNIICSTLGGQRGNPRLSLASSTWPKGDCEATAIFSQTHKPAVETLRQQLKTELLAIAQTIPDTPLVSANLNHVGRDDITIPGYAPIMADDLDFTWIRNVATLLLKETNRKSAKLTAPMWTGTKFIMPFTEVYRHERDIYGTPKKDKEMSTILQTLLLDMMGKKTPAYVSQEWVLNSTLNSGSRMRPAVQYGTTHFADPITASAHEHIRLHGIIKETLHVNA